MDRATPVAFAVLFGVVWIGMLGLVWSRGNARSDGLVYLEVFFGLAVLTLAVSYVRASLTVFTTEGVWRPGPVPGRGRFVRWAEVAELRPIARGKGVSAVDLLGRFGTVRIHVAPYQDAEGVMRLITERVGVRSDEWLPAGGQPRP